MRGRVIALLGVLAAFGAAGACALDIPDVIAPGGVDANGGDAAPKDVNVVDVPIPQCDASCAPTGFTPVLFALDQSTACPGGMQQVDVNSDPGAAPPSACACDCTITTQPQCLPTTITHEIQTVSDGGPPSCTVGGNALSFDGGCLQLAGFNIHYAWQGDPYPPLEAGTCTSAVTVSTKNVPSTASRMCVDTTCTGTCAGQGKFKACVYAAGAVACPSGYTQTHHAGDIDVACGTCSGCSVTGGSCEGTVSIYSDLACTTKIIDVSMDGGCASTGNANGQTGNSLKYTPLVTGVACTAGKSNVGTVSLVNEITVCCP
jgi:hypothetical protein